LLRVVWLFGQTNDEQQQDSADRCRDDGTDQSAYLDSKKAEGESSNDRANNANDDIAQQPETAAFHQRTDLDFFDQNDAYFLTLSH
jgi:uncharacterized protein (DUF2225 family)